MPPLEILVISGKGGTGKTSVVASFAALADSPVLADCDVDAADLHLILAPKVRHRYQFVGGKTARVISDLCTACGKCASVCRFGAVSMTGPSNDVIGKTYAIDPVLCEGCGVCAYFCPAEAVELSPQVCGEWFVSETRYGPMVHAKLGVGAENSGKLVTEVRKEARRVAERSGSQLVLIDGSPGIGCPVIASLTGVDVALIVTEPTLSGLHDMERVAELASHFRVPPAICINKCDINEEMADKIRARAEALEIEVLGEIHYDPAVTAAQIEALSVVEYGRSPSADDIRALWTRLKEWTAVLPSADSIALAKG